MMKRKILMLLLTAGMGIAACSSSRETTSGTDSTMIDTDTAGTIETGTTGDTTGTGTTGDTTRTRTTGDTTATGTTNPR